MALRDSTHVECGGLDHLDFTSDDKYAIATCEFSGQLVKIDLTTRRPMAYLKLQKATLMPQDIRSSPDGTKFYVADMKQDGVYVIDPERFVETKLHQDGEGNARHRRWTRRHSVLHQQSWMEHDLRTPARGRLDHRARSRDGENPCDMAIARRWKSGHGQRLRGWEAVVALRALRRRSLCLRHHHRLARETHSCRARAARSLRLAATGPRLAGPHSATCCKGGFELQYLQPARAASTPSRHDRARPFESHSRGLCSARRPHPSHLPPRDRR